MHSSAQQPRPRFVIAGIKHGHIHTLLPEKANRAPKVHILSIAFSSRKWSSSAGLSTHFTAHCQCCSRAMRHSFALPRSGRLVCACCGAGFDLGLFRNRTASCHEVSLEIFSLAGFAAITSSCEKTRHIWGVSNKTAATHQYCKRILHQENLDIEILGCILDSDCDYEALANSVPHPSNRGYSRKLATTKSLLKLHCPSAVSALCSECRLVHSQVRQPHGRVRPRR